MKLFRNKHHEVDPLWHVQAVLVVVIALQVLLPTRLNVLPQFLVPSLEVLCLIALQLVTPPKAVFESRVRRLVVFALIGLVVIANGTSLELLIGSLFNATREDAPGLLLSAANIYLTNIVIFGLCYWEMDAGGPGQRRSKEPEGDFLFPQQNLSQPAARAWYPTFIDYLYVSVTNATAFSPTDTLPLSRRAKILMTGQAFLSLSTVILVAARAINLL
jgi:uncharacterized membrane protein